MLAMGIPLWQPDRKELKNVPVEDRTRLVSDNGSSYLSHAFEDYLRMRAIRHIRCAPHHPQTNGKISRPSSDPDVFLSLYAGS